MQAVQHPVGNGSVRLLQRRVLHARADGQVRSDPDALLTQGAADDSPRRDQRRRDSSAEMSSPAVVGKTVVLAVGGIVTVTGTGAAAHLVVVPAVLLRVGNPYAERRPGGIPVEHAAFYDKGVCLRPCRRRRPLRAAAGQLLRDTLPVHRNAGRQAVQHGADAAAVALAEQCQGQCVSVYVFHRNEITSPQDSVMASRLSFCSENRPISGTRTVVMPSAAAFLSCARAARNSSFPQRKAVGRS